MRAVEGGSQSRCLLAVAVNRNPTYWNCTRKQGPRRQQEQQDEPDPAGVDPPRVFAAVIFPYIGFRAPWDRSTVPNFAINSCAHQVPSYRRPYRCSVSAISTHLTQASYGDEPSHRQIGSGPPTALNAPHVSNSAPGSCQRRFAIAPHAMCNVQQQHRLSRLREKGGRAADCLHDYAHRLCMYMDTTCTQVYVNSICRMLCRFDLSNTSLIHALPCDPTPSV